MQKVPHSELEPGKSYYIQAIKPNGSTKMIGVFRKHGIIPDGGDYRLAFFDNFTKINCRGEYAGRSVHLNRSWNFYEIKKHDIQRNMEKHTLESVLKNVIGDENFTTDLL